MHGFIFVILVYINNNKLDTDTNMHKYTLTYTVSIIYTEFHVLEHYRSIYHFAIANKASYDHVY